MTTATPTDGHQHLFNGMDKCIYCDAARAEVAAPAKPVEEPAPAVVQEEARREAVEQKALEAQELAQTVAKVDLHFPTIGFIDPATELEKVRQAAAAMPEDQRSAYPEKIRAALLAHHANPDKVPAVSDDELRLAIYIKRTAGDAPLSVEDVEAKTTGKVAKAPKEPKAPKTTKPAKKDLDDILGGL